MSIRKLTAPEYSEQSSRRHALDAVLYYSTKTPRDQVDRVVQVFSSTVPKLTGAASAPADGTGPQTQEKIF